MSNQIILCPKKDFELFSILGQCLKESVKKEKLICFPVKMSVQGNCYICKQERPCSMLIVHELLLNDGGQCKKGLMLATAWDPLVGRNASIKKNTRAKQLTLMATKLRELMREVYQLFQSFLKNNHHCKQDNLLNKHQSKKWYDEMMFKYL